MIALVLHYSVTLLMFCNLSLCCLITIHDKNLLVTLMNYIYIVHTCMSVYHVHTVPLEDRIKCHISLELELEVIGSLLTTM